MDEAREQQLKKLLHAMGHNGLGLSDNRWKQLDAIERVVRVMLERRREAYGVLKENELTIMNLERMFVKMADELKSVGAEGFTDSTARYGDSLLMDFFLSFRSEDIVIPVDKSSERELRQENKMLRERIAKMSKRDGEAEEWKALYDSLKKDFDQKVADLDAEVSRSKDLEARLRKASASKAIGQLVLPFGEENDKKN